MPDSYTEVTYQPWGSRIQDSLVGALVGLVLFLGAFPLLFLNEGSAVDRLKTLEEGENKVEHIDANQVFSTNEGKLVHLIGETTTDETLKDTDFGVAVNKVIKLRRVVKIYQWQEDQHSETRQKLGGGTEKVTTYTYTKTWQESLIDSNDFKRPEGHENPVEMPVSEDTFIAKQVNLGDFTLSSNLVSKLNNYLRLPMTTETLGQVQEGVRTQLFRGSMTETTRELHLHYGEFYVGQNPVDPQVGDLRIKFQVVRPTTISVVAKQVTSSLAPYTTEVGGSIELFEYGTVTAEDMFKHAKMSSTLLTWFLRLVGFLVMFFGLSMIFNVLKVMTDFIPFLGDIVEWLGLFIAVIVAATLSLITIAIAWLYSRPLWSITVIVIALALLYFLKFARQPQQPSRQPQQPSRQPQQPSLEQPLQPSLEQPLQPSLEQPLQPSLEQPLQPSLEQPLQSSLEQPLQPSLELQPVLVPETIVPNKSI